MNGMNKVTLIRGGSALFASTLAIACGGSDPLLGPGVPTQVETPSPIKLELVDSPSYELAPEYAIQGDTRVPRIVAQFEYEMIAPTDGAEFSNVKLPETFVTRRFEIGLNLDANASQPARSFDVANLKESTNFGLTLRAFDEVGEPRHLFLYFAKNANAWDWHLLEVGSMQQIASGELFFAPTGELYMELITQANGPTIDFGGSVQEGASGLEGSTSYPAPFRLEYVGQDGHAFQ